MDDAALVGPGEAGGDLGGQAGRFVDGEGAALDLRLERLAVVAGHGEEELAVGALPELVDGGDVRVVQGGGGLRLFEEPLLGHGVASQGRRQEFQRHRAQEAGVLGPEDQPHAAAADLFEDAIVRDAAAGPSPGAAGTSAPALPAPIPGEMEGRLVAHGQVRLSMGSVAESRAGRPCARLHPPVICIP